MHYDFNVRGLEQTEGTRKGHSCQYAVQCMINGHYGVVKWFTNWENNNERVEGSMRFFGRIEDSEHFHPRIS
jgi:hypothetical protein